MGRGGDCREGAKLGADTLRRTHGLDGPMDKWTVGWTCAQKNT